MEKYDELIKSLESCRDLPDEYGRSVAKQTAEAIARLNSVINEKQKLLDEALGDLAKCGECKYCANIDQCRIRSIERNLAYGSCNRWQWRGEKAVAKAS